MNRHLRPEPGVTELRIHGVGGTTPEALLEQTGVRQVTGDAEAGFYRGAIPEPTRTVEAYSWGGLTAKSWSRAFWVLLLPFSLINIAGWMVDPPVVHSDGEQEAPDTLKRSAGVKSHEALVLLIGMLTTVLYVMWAAMIAMNTGAFQCGGIEECRAGRWYMAVFDAAFFHDHPGRRIVVGAAVPLGLLALFVWLGKSSRSKYEKYAETERTDISRSAPERLPSMVADPRLWYDESGWQAEALYLHVAAALLILGGLLGRATAQFEERFGVDVVPDVGYWLFWIAVAGVSGVAARLIFVAFSSRRMLGDRIGETRKGRTVTHRFAGDHTASYVLLGSAGVVMATALALTWNLDVPDARLVPRIDGPASPVTDLWGFGWAPILLLAAAVLCVGGFSLVQLARWWTAKTLHLDQLSVVIMLTLLVLWDQARYVVLAGLAAGIVSLARDHRRGDPPWRIRPTALAWRRFAYFSVVLAIAGVLHQLTADAAAPWGVGWPRVTPMLGFTVVLAGFHIVASRWPPTGTLRPGDMTPWYALVIAIPSALIAAGYLMATITERDEWGYGTVGLAWVVLAVAWLARFSRRGWRWNGPGAIALLGLTLLMGSFSGTVIFLVDLLDGDGATFTLSATAIYEWLTVGFAAFLIAGALAGVVWWLVISQSRDGTRDRKKGEFLPEAVRAVDVVVTMIAMLALAGGIALLIHLWEMHGAAFHDWIDSGVPPDWAGIATVASWIAVGVALGAVFAVRQGLKQQEFRTRLGIVWDVASFWPRAFHPFATPAYSARAVPELQERLVEIATNARQTPSQNWPGTDHEGTSHGIAIISGHSQGSVLSLAAVASLPHEVAERVWLVTHGSPLLRFYGNYFPRYFPETLFAYCARKLGPTDGAADGTWLNFWRRTDPICDPVFEGRSPSSSAMVDPPRQILDTLNHAKSRTGLPHVELPDVELADPFEDGYPYGSRPRIRGHSGYMADPAMWETIDTLSQFLTQPRDPPGTTDALRDDQLTDGTERGDAPTQPPEL